MDITAKVNNKTHFVNRKPETTFSNVKPSCNRIEENVPQARSIYFICTVNGAMSYTQELLNKRMYDISDT